MQPFIILISGGENGMPTFNQLVKQGRKTAVKKSTAPALQKGYNSLQKKATASLNTFIKVSGLGCEVLGNSSHSASLV